MQYHTGTVFLMTTVLQENKECYVCGKTEGLNSHHVFPGSRRKISEKYGLKVWLCVYHHTASKDSVHENPNKGLDLKLKQMAQTYYESYYGSRDDFIQEFGKSWL